MRRGGSAKKKRGIEGLLNLFLSDIRGEIEFARGYKHSQDMS